MNLVALFPQRMFGSRRVPLFVLWLNRHEVVNESPRILSEEVNQLLLLFRVHLVAVKQLVMSRAEKHDVNTVIGVQFLHIHDVFAEPFRDEMRPF